MMLIVIIIAGLYI